MKYRVNYGRLRMKKRTKNIVLVIVGILTILTGGVFAYLSDSYAPSSKALFAMSSTELVEVVQQEDYQAFLPNDDSGKDGLIFYQGGKVEAEAYAPLMQELAENGIPSYLIEMPFNLAVFDINAADTVISEEPDIENWYLAGHSLGGAMASSYVEKKGEQLAGLILLASYSAADLTDKDLPALLIYGTADEVMNRETYEENLSFLPNREEVMLEGGNHAQFGSYGEQSGDGTATMSGSEQLKQTVDAIVNFVQ